MSEGRNILFILACVLGFMCVATLIACCSGFAWMTHNSLLLAEEVRATQASALQQVAGDWIEYGVVREVKGKKKKRTLSKHVLGMRIEKDTVRIVREGTTPRPLTYHFLEIEETYISIELVDPPSGVQAAWAFHFRGDEVRVPHGDDFRAMRRDPKALKALMAKQDTAWEAEEVQLKGSPR